MPEIKHQFTGGKMNKDLDERLVPNGQYRDALNIQVSTSEASDVGTVQNILGNSLIPGQDFIADGTVCVGSIADEKNDKLYYFIVNDEELIVNGGFDGDSSGWNFTGTTPFEYENGYIKGEDVPQYAKLNQYIPTNKFFLDREYEISFTISGYVEGTLKVNLYNEVGDGFIIEAFIPENKTYTFTKKVNASITSNTSYYGRFWIQSWNSSIDFTGNIDNVSIKPKDSAIIEYDSTTNTITPVLVDTTNEVLKFNPDNIVTGISIIDDLLFWTDNENEPKKINIQRSIEGTDSSGTVHTDFINDKRTDSFGLIKEEHITVIKKAPKSAPTIELISERPLDNGKIHTGVMKVTTAPFPPLQSPDPFISINTQNESSLWVHPESGYNHLYDFSTLKVGDEIHTQIETDINGDSGFELSWEVGDTIVFKEFGGENGDEAPEIPIKDYTIKATIGNLDQKWTTTPPTFRFTDESLEFAQNGNFTIPDANGNEPKYYNWNAWEGFVYSPGGNNIYGDDVDQYSKITSTPSTTFTTSGKYTISFTLSDLSSSTPLSGPGIKVFIVKNVGGSYPPYWETPYATTAGTHTFTVDTSTAGSTSSDFNNYSGKWFFQAGIGTDTDGDGTDDVGAGFTGRIDNVSIIEHDDVGSFGNAAIRCHIKSITGTPPPPPEGQTELRYAVDKPISQEKIFEFKFPRFAYRYQYEDREYSTMSPFSPVAFVPGSFDYHPKKGYNLGMTNRINEIGIKNFRTNVPDGVIAIDILYKDDLSPNIYIVDTIKPKHNPLGGGSNIWDEDAFVVTSDQISQMLPSNQLLRLWDAVPKKALAQDVSGNRIIYGNYVQGFDLKAGDRGASEDYYPDFNFNMVHNDNTSLNPKKSIKSLREYQLGVVFVDEYGRETPVISNSSGTYKLDKLEAEKSSKIQVNFGNTKYPENMKYFKFFIKETSGEYYNLAMDRHYDAEDGQIWLSFPSSDRNKLDVDTFLILKKGVESDEMVSAEAKYKVLDIQNEAPDFIKFDKQLIEEQTHIFDEDDADGGLDNIFEGGLVDVPLAGNDSFKMNYNQFHGSTGSNLHEIKDSDLHVEFGNTTNNTSKRYRITEITTDYIVGQSVPTLGDSKYSVKLDKKLGDDVNFITNDDSGLSPSKIDDGTVVNIYKYTKENSSKFDGRFFVKINIDSTFNENITVPSVTSTKYRTVASKKLYYLTSKATNDVLHSSALTGQTHGLYAGDFGKFAPFFRNYNSTTSNTSLTLVSGGTPEISQYKFGSPTVWKRELKWFTSGINDGAGNYVGFDRGSSSNPMADSDTTLKKADDHGWSDEERDGVFNSDGEQEKGEVWFIDEGHHAGFRFDYDNLHWAHSSGSPRYINPGGGDPAGIGTTTVNNVQYGLLELAVGGIYHSNWHTSTGSNATSEFFNIGRDGGNPNYDGGGNTNLVSKIYPGQKFRFKEDPNGEVYTIQPGIGDARRIRWGTIEQYQNSSAVIPYYSFQWWIQYGPGGSTSDWTNSDWVSATVGTTGNGHDFTDYAKQLSPNFTRGWKPKFLNSSGDSTVNWDPTGNPGPIANGLQLSIQHSGTASGGSAPEKYVVVDDLSATNHDGTTHSITTGMILTSHSDDGTPTVYDGATLGFESLAIKRIESSGNVFRLYLTGYSKILAHTNDSPLTGDIKHDIFTNAPTISETMVFEQPKMNGYSQYSVNRLNAQWPALGGIMAIGYNLEFVEAIESEPIMPSNPAIWETEPKESTDLDIYYEAGGLNPLILEEETKLITIPLLSTVEHIGGGGANWIETGTTVEAVVFDGTDWTITLASPSDHSSATADAANTLLLGSLVGGSYIALFDKLRITKPNGDIIVVEITGFGYQDTNNRTSIFEINPALYGDKTQYDLNWYNCYSFGNGVESNRIRDSFNLPFISNGVKVSTTLEEGHYEERRSGGLIYSGIYNSNGSINNLNQFIAAEKITKDLNPIYGSIQKLHSRDTDLVTLCEDKCLRILANKDAVYNADGNPQLTANINVLGQTIPFSGEFGISKNPESFASESYRVYFTDKVRGAVMRLSKDGLTPISMHGMKDWFKDNLKISNKVIGSHDDKKEEYNVTLTIAPGYTNNPSTTVSFKEDVRGWVSFKSFIPEQGISMANDYYTMLNGRLYKHHDESEDRNNFYGNDYNSSINVILNDGPGSVKSFHTLCYEGSQADIEVPSVNDGEYYNLTGKFGWFVSGIETDKQVGGLIEFIEKEGKWFNYIKGVDSSVTAETDFGAFDIQGIGSTPITGFNFPPAGGLEGVLAFDKNPNTSLQIGDIVYEDTVYTTSGGFQTIDPTNFNNLGTVIYIGTWEDYPIEIFWDTPSTGVWAGHSDSAMTQANLMFTINGSPDLYKYVIIVTNAPSSAMFGNNYYFFAKNHIVNTSSLLGYYADVKFENNSTEKAELFAVSSEITESSK